MKAFFSLVAVLSFAAPAFARDESFVKEQVVTSCYQDCKVGALTKASGQWVVQEVPAKTFVLVIDHYGKNLKFKAGSESLVQVTYEATVAPDGKLTSNFMGPRDAGYITADYEIEFNDGSSKCSVKARHDLGPKFTKPSAARSITSWISQD